MEKDLKAYLGYVEFDDQDKLWSQHQLATVVSGIERLADKRPPKLISYAHGWNSSAKEGGGTPRNSLATFKRRLVSLDQVSRAERGYPYQVVGVY